MSAPSSCPFCLSDEIAPFRGKYRCFICGREFSAEEQTTERTFTPLRLFISYGHTEHPICRMIADALTRRGHQVWFDEDKRPRIKAGESRAGAARTRYFGKLYQKTKLSRYQTLIKGFRKILEKQPMRRGFSGSFFTL